eukprot:m.96891 g.96891  ORF g.96891 m.96891 type:complete len:173 (-) comp12476_c0_seq6:326-844(-)
MIKYKVCFILCVCVDEVLFNSLLFAWSHLQVPISIFKVSLVDLLPFTVSFLGSLLLGIEEGVGIAVGVNILYVLYFSARPGNKLLAPKLSRSLNMNNDDCGEFETVKYSDDVVSRMPGGVMIVQAGSSLVCAHVHTLTTVYFLSFFLVALLSIYLLPLVVLLPVKVVVPWCF